MEESPLPHGAFPCKFCDNPAQHECQNCDDPLCTDCKKTHEREKPHHKYVPYSQKGHRICKEHIGNKYIYLCETCTVPCCSKCFIISHNGHKIKDIDEAISSKKDTIREIFKDPLKENLIKWRTLHQESKVIRDEYKAKIQEMNKELDAHVHLIHTAVDRNAEKVRCKLRETINSNSEALETQEEFILGKYEELERSVTKLEDLSDSNDINILFTCTIELDDITTLPTLVRHSPPGYSLGQINDEKLMMMICNLDTTISPTRVISLYKRENFPSFKLGCYFQYVAITISSGHAWIMTGRERIQLMDRQGTVKDTINTKFWIRDVTTTPQGNVLFTTSAFAGPRIALASKGAASWNIKTLFSPQYCPCGICCLRNGDIILTFLFQRPSTITHRVIQYNENGGIIYEFDDSLFSVPSKVAVNKVNDDLYVCDIGKSKLLVFQTDHVIRYEYTGSDDQSFDPRDVSTDLCGLILITDMDNNKIHILDKDGKFLQYLQFSRLEKPRHIDVDNEGNAWIVEEEGRVKIVKYS